MMGTDSSKATQASSNLENFNSPAATSEIIFGKRSIQLREPEMHAAAETLCRIKMNIRGGRK